MYIMTKCFKKKKCLWFIWQVVLDEVWEQDRILSFVLEVLYSTGIIVWNLGVQTVSSHSSGVLKGNVVFSTLSQLLDLDYLSKREAAGQG